MKLIFFFFVISKILNDNNINDEDIYSCSKYSKYPEEWDEYCFQTPPRNDTLGNYKESFQDMHYLVGYTQLKYSENKTQCTISIITKVNSKLGLEGIHYKIYYKFGETEQIDNSFKITASNSNSYQNGLSLSARIIDTNNNEIAKLELEKVYFIWDNIKLKKNRKFENGQKGVIVELFGWPYDDIAEECEFLHSSGYLGVKILPPNEAILTYNTVEDGELNPWWYFLQPVSYKLESRLGNRTQLKNMIDKCRKNNIRIYSQIVINHMVGNGNDMYQSHKRQNCFEWGQKTGSAGSPFWTTKGRDQNNQYTGNIPVFEFPAVPYFATDFHCYKQFESKEKTDELNNGWIGDLIDLNTEKDYVQQRIADFITDLLSIGISGISIINARHISPINYVFIFKKLKINFGNDNFPEDFIAILELSYKNNEEIILCDNDYSFAEPFVRKLIYSGFTDNDINKIKIGNEEPDALPIYENVWKINQTRHVMSFENYDIQKSSVNNDFSYIIKKNIEIHRNKTVEMIKRDDIQWKIKIVFSSYSLFNESNGFPDGKSDCSKCISENCKKYCIKSVPYEKAYNPLSTGYDAGNSENWKEGKYTRIHRDKFIINAVREWMNLDNLNDDEIYEDEINKAYNCTDDIPYVIIETGFCTKECTTENFFNHICKIKNEKNQKAKDELLKNIETQIMNGTIDELLFSITNNEKKDLIVETNDILYQITSSYNQNNKIYNNISILELGDCEKILKEKYNLDDEQDLIILKVEFYQEGLIIPIIEYEIFHPITKEKLNLDFCSNSTISLLIPVTIDESSLYKYNSSSDYYTDKCYPYTTINSTDIILEDRLNEYISNNLSICESNCEYSGYDTRKKKVICDCSAKTSFSLIPGYRFNKTKLIDNFKIKGKLNLFVFKCYNSLFTKEGFTENIGNYVIISIIIYYSFSRYFFFIKGFYLFKQRIIKLINIRNENIIQNNINYNINENMVNNINKKNDEIDNITIDENINDNNNINDNDIKNSNTIIIDKNINDNKYLFKNNRLNNNFNTSKTLSERYFFKKNPPKKKVKIKKKKKPNIRNVSSLNIINANGTNNILIYHKNDISPKNNISNNSSINKINKNSVLSSYSKEIININNNKKIQISEFNEYNYYNDYELNHLTFKLALEIDKRNYFQYYLSLLKTNHIIFFTFFNYNDYNSFLIKTCLLLFSFSLYFTVNTLFFTDSTMHEIYENEGKDILIYRFPQIIYSTIITTTINYLVKYISLSQKNILELKNDKDIEKFNNKIEIIFKCLIIKFNLFFDISFLFLFLFWYYISCFCSVYKNTQKYLIKDTLISFALNLLYEFIINLLPGILRIQALRENNNNRECIYKISKILQIL